MSGGDYSQLRDSSAGFFRGIQESGVDGARGRVPAARDNQNKKKGKEKERSGDYIDLMPSSIATSIDEYDFV